MSKSSTLPFQGENLANLSLEAVGVEILDTTVPNRKLSRLNENSFTEKLKSSPARESRGGFFPYIIGDLSN